MSENKKNKTPNRLIDEKSPYLLQHAYNPVSWFPWGEEAFEKARVEDKPIFLSIGYSTCHWCHVMGRESFEDEEVAEILNKDFVPIKVDKEERPDIDTVYMMACQLFTSQGGWPTTLILTPDKAPIFAGTYFPKQSIGGRTGLIDILGSVKSAWKDKRQEVEDSGKDMVAKLNAADEDDRSEWRNISLQDSSVTKDLIYEGVKQLQGSFDEMNGGFGRSPKFPTPQNLLFLLAFSKSYKDDYSLRIAEKTLTQMYRGGIFDHIGGGFSRYSTDSRWMVPHFEKMLYDNALLSFVYAEAYRLTEDAIYKEVAVSTLDYVLREMTSPEGGFYCAQDADSEGEEGKYYVFTKEEILEQLGDEKGTSFCDAYDVTQRGNFEGKSIPNLLYNYDYEEAAARFKFHKGVLLDYRIGRMNLHKDDKILTSWSSMMIAAFAYAGGVFNEKKYVDAAVKGEIFINEKLARKGKRLRVRFKDNETIGNGYLDDYAYYIWALLELYESTKKVDYLQKAIDYNDMMSKDFADKEGGGYYFTAFDSEKLIYRPKETYDGAIPSGNSMAAWILLRLAKKMDSSELMNKAEEQLRFLVGIAGRYPIGHSFTLFVLTEYMLLSTHRNKGIS